MILYLNLRKENKIGKLWCDGGKVFQLAPLGALPGCEYRMAEFIVEDKLVLLIHRLSGLTVERKPVVSEWDQVTRRFKAG